MLFFDSMNDLISKAEGFANEIKFLLSGSTVFFLFPVIQRISLSEVSTKEVLLWRSSSRFNRLCEKCLFGSLFLGKL